MGREGVVIIPTEVQQRWTSYQNTMNPIMPPDVRADFPGGKMSGIRAIEGKMACNRT